MADADHKSDLNADIASDIEAGRLAATPESVTPSPAGVKTTEQQPLSSDPAGPGEAANNHNQDDCAGVLAKQRPTVGAVLSTLFWLVATLVAAAVMEGVWDPPEQEFDRNDMSIAHPLLPETISTKQLIGVWVALPILIILAFDVINNCRWMCGRPRKAAGGTYWAQVGIQLWLIFHRLCVHLIIGAIVLALTAIAKNTVGEFRPHFISVCNPDYTGIPATQAYVPLSVCTGAAADILEARKSFFSGHSSAGFLYMMLLSLYVYAIHERLQAAEALPKRLTYRIWPIVIQTIALGSSFYVASSRVHDAKHHLHDVIIGGLVGIAGAVFLFVQTRHQQQWLTIKCCPHARGTHHGAEEQQLA